LVVDASNNSNNISASLTGMHSNQSIIRKHIKYRGECRIVLSASCSISHRTLSLSLLGRRNYKPQYGKKNATQTENKEGIIQ